MTTRTHWLFPLALFVLLTGCFSSPGPQTGPLARYDRTQLTQAEISATTAGNVYEAVRMLRPQWLRKRGTVSITQPTEIAVYVDDVRFGGPESLQALSTHSVVLITFMDAASATQRWGTDHVHGAIVVRTM